MKFYGKIGFGTVAETEAHSGIWQDTIVEHYYYGDFVKASKRDRENMDSVNDNIVLSHQITVLADAFISQNYQDIRYVEVEGAKWKVTYVEIQPPRLRLTLGGVWNGQ